MPSFLGWASSIRLRIQWSWVINKVCISFRASPTAAAWQRFAWGFHSPCGQGSDSWHMLMTRNQRSSYYVLWYIHAPNHLGDVYPLVNLNQDESRASLENWLPNHRFLFQVGVLVCPGNNLSPSHAKAITPMKKFCQPQDKDMLLSHIDTPKSKQRPNMSSQKEKMTLSTYHFSGVMSVFQDGL